MDNNEVIVQGGGSPQARACNGQEGECPNCHGNEEPEEEESMKMLQEDWMKEYNYAGSFQTALMKTIEKADRVNLVKLEKVYPELVQAYRKYSGRE